MMSFLPREFSHGVRQLASLIMAGTLAWDYFRSPEILGLFSTWTLLLHFIYFQLPLQSRALPYLQSISFVGANVIPVLYVFLLIWKPKLEINHMEIWEISWTTVIFRAILINLSPLIFHALDLSLNQNKYIISYQAIPSKFIIVWSCLSYGIYNSIFHLLIYQLNKNFELNELQDQDNNLSSDLNELNLNINTSEHDFQRNNRIMFIIANSFAVLLLYLLIFRKAYRKTTRKLSTSSGLYEQVNTNIKID